MVTIARIEPDDETTLDNIINSLRSKDNLISHHIQAIKERRATQRTSLKIC
jgi:hypothetical protein